LSQEKKTESQSDVKCRTTTVAQQQCTKKDYCNAILIQERKERLQPQQAHQPHHPRLFQKFLLHFCLSSTAEVYSDKVNFLTVTTWPAEEGKAPVTAAAVAARVAAVALPISKSVSLAI
jgi:hypothetical protein